jgi:hypothetical protein
MLVISEARVRKLIVVGFAVIGLSGCTVRSVDCALGTPHEDCAKDTAGYRAEQEEQQAKQTFETIDDARCKSYGQPGSARYAQCRADLDKQRGPTAR